VRSGGGADERVLFCGSETPGLREGSDMVSREAAKSAKTSRELLLLPFATFAASRDPTGYGEIRGGSGQHETSRW
jgi:hypothetical protein